jgi:hypothetical protein
MSFRSMSRNDVIELSLTYHHETFSAVLFSDDGEHGRTVWLPKSQVEVDWPDEYTDGDILDVRLPEWLALDKGLI